MERQHTNLNLAINMQQWTWTKDRQNNSESFVKRAVLNNTYMHTLMSLLACLLECLSTCLCAYLLTHLLTNLLAYFIYMTHTHTHALSPSQWHATSFGQSPWMLRAEFTKPEPKAWEILCMHSFKCVYAFIQMCVDGCQKKKLLRTNFYTKMIVLNQK